MPHRPIRVKLIVGLSLVVGMMLTLLAGSVFGLHAFHASNLTLTDQLRELGASKDLLQAVLRLDLDDQEIDELLEEARPARGRREADPGGEGGAIPDDRRRRELLGRIEVARGALGRYYAELNRNSNRGNRSDGRDEFTLAFLIDDDLVGILEQLGIRADAGPLFERTRVFLGRHPQHDLLVAGPWEPFALARARLDRLTASAAELPDKLHSDFFLVLESSKRHYQSSRVIVWTAALAVLAMLGGLTALVNRWVLTPVRLLHRGVRHVARGSFDYRISLDTGDEMQALAEAFNDMTTRLGASYAELEQQVAERSRQLVRSERLAGVGFLAAGVAHEINNPLASIAFCAEAIEGRLGPIVRDAEADGSGDGAVVRDYLRMIQEEAFRCKRITEKLLDFSRCGEIQRQRTDLAELISAVVEMVRHMGKYRGKQVVFQPREAVLALVDPQELKQVILNLVVNALDSMEPGGTLRIEARNVAGIAELAFRDDGCGMAPEVLENIFEPFFTRRRVGKGTGLGLSISHRIVSQHHGEIAATSPGEGLGSTFTVRIPSRAGAARPRRDPGTPTPAGVEGLRRHDPCVAHPTATGVDHPSTPENSTGGLATCRPHSGSEPA